MKVRILKSGSIVHIPNNELSQILIESGLVTPVVDAPPAPGKAVWGAGSSPFTGELLITATCARCHQGTQIGGRNAFESKATFNHCGQAEPIPNDIRELGKQFVANQKARASANKQSAQEREEMKDAMPQRPKPLALLV